MFNRSFYDNIVLNAYSNIQPWIKIGYNPLLATAEEDIWPLSTIYGSSGLMLTSPVQMEIIGSENVDDIGTIIRGSRSVPITSDAGGSTTTLLDADVDFGAGGGTAVVAGDILLLDPSGTTSPNIPEWGYITSVATHTLTCSGGFSSGGAGTTRKYLVIDASAHIGALVIKVSYLTSAYLERTLLIPTNGTTVVTTLNDAGAALSDLYRINSFRIIATGTNYRPTGNWFIRTVSGGTVWGYIVLGYNESRNNIYTVPAAKTLYLTTWECGWSTPDATKIQSARIFLRANMDIETLFNTGNIFYPITELIVSNEHIPITKLLALKIPQKTDLRVQGIAYATGTGPCASTLQGYIVS